MEKISIHVPYTGWKKHVFWVPHSYTKPHSMYNTHIFSEKGAHSKFKNLDKCIKITQIIVSFHIKYSDQTTVIPKTYSEYKFNSLEAKFGA